MTPGRLVRALDYRTFVLAIVLVLVVGVVSSVQSANDRARDAIVARDADREAANRRIEALTAEIARLATTAGDNRAVIGRLEAQIAALREQVRQMGGAPVVVVRDDPEPSPSPQPSPSPSPPSPTPTPTPSATTPPPTCRPLPIVERCLP